MAELAAAFTFLKRVSMVRALTRWSHQNANDPRRNPREREPLDHEVARTVTHTGRNRRRSIRRHQSWSRSRVRYAGNWNQD